MLRRSSLLTVLTLFAGVASASAAPGMLDLVPDDASAALMLRSVSELKKKGDKLAADTDMDPGFRPSDLFKYIYDHLGIQAAVDEDRPAGIILVDKKYGNNGDLNLDELFKRLVLVVPFTDRDKMAANFGLKPGELKPDKVLKVKAKINPMPGFVAVRESHLLLGIHEPAVASLLKSAPLAKALAPERVKSLESADLLLHVNPQGALGKEWKNGLKAEEKRLEESFKDIDPEVRRQFFDTLTSLQFLFVSLRLDDGLHLSVLHTFPKDMPEPAKKFLARLEGGPGASDLTGLPEGAVVVAQGAQGDGVRNAFALKLLYHYFSEAGAPGNRVPFWSDQLDPSQRLTVVGMVTEVWKLIKGQRAAIYRNADPTKQGLFNVVAILDTDDAGRFLGEIKQLARYAGSAAMDLSAKTAAKEDLQTVKKLIEDLDDRRFPVRESATTKLELLGEPVLPHLEEVLKSQPPLELRRRAETIKARIVMSAQERRKGLFSDVARRLQPSFVYVAKAETHEATPVDVLRIKLADRDIPAMKQFAQLFGPEWDRVRVAVHGKQVVVLWGSDVKLLPATLRNLKEGRRGLADAKQMAPFLAHADASRKIEFHASFQTLVGLTRAEDLKDPDARKTTPSMSSLSLSVGPDRIQYDFRLPTAEIKFLAKEVRQRAGQ